MNKKTASQAATKALTKSKGKPTVSPPGDDSRFPIVGIGASAGGLAAFEAFFSGMPADVDPGMAFVLVQHLAPDHKSILSDLIRRYTRMQVFEVEDGMPVRINCAYIIPPNRDMAFLGGSLQLLEPSAPRGQRLPIDFFFRSLAADQHERAIGIVLSGTGSDGTLGVRAIKGESGMVMAQSPESTEFDGMPRSALATGLVDYQLTPEQMPAQLISYAQHAYGRAHPTEGVPAPLTENALKKIYVLLRAQIGHDFSSYKPSTIQRRIERRMAVHQIEAIDDYVKFLQQTPPEVEALFHDLLIGVTHFFRDTEAFLVLQEQGIPKLFANKRADAVIRVWITGCSTGEEAYSLAILLQERMEVLKHSYTVQIFATDIDPEAIATARIGLYPASIAADMSAERLNRFFTPEPLNGGYRVHKGIRDMLVFSEQSLIKDPPFSKLDLICCRNLLIYLGADLQKMVIPLFHYALNPGGLLFLGSSEGVGGFDDLFGVVDRKAKLYQRKDSLLGLQRTLMNRVLPGISAISAELPRSNVRSAFPVKLPLREMTEQAMLRQLAPTAALVNGHGDILYLHGRSGMYLEPSAGEAGISNILKMARQGLRPALSSALHKALSSGQTVQVAAVRVKTNGHYSLVDLNVSPVTTHLDVPTELPLFLVLLEEGRGADLRADGIASAGSAGGARAPTPESEHEARIAALTQELRAKDEYLQSTHEELESSTEELKSSNEEMQSVNEELQSTNEELETSKEELQSVNEELATVNTELQSKVTDLSRTNDDMSNLLAGTGIGTVFVDHQLRILRFTPAASAIINLIATDVGRPVAHIVSNLVGYTDLVVDLRAVLDSLIPKEVDVQAADGKWYTLRIQPYRTLDNVIEGAVISFIDITEVVRVRDALAKANDQLRLAVVLRDASDAMTVQDLEGRMIAWNPAAERLYGWSEAQALAMNARERIPGNLREGALEQLSRLSRAEVLQPYHTQRLTSGGSVLEVSIISSALLAPTGQMYAIATTERAQPARPV
jgi:two-component system CheB/CheR fusion protein